MLCWKYSCWVVIVMCVVCCYCEKRTKRDDGDSSAADGGSSMSHLDNIYYPQPSSDHDISSDENSRQEQPDRRVHVGRQPNSRRRQFVRPNTWRQQIRPTGGVQRRTWNRQRVPFVQQRPLPPTRRQPGFRRRLPVQRTLSSPRRLPVSTRWSNTQRKMVPARPLTPRVVPSQTAQRPLVSRTQPSSSVESSESTANTDESSDEDDDSSEEERASDAPSTLATPPVANITTRVQPVPTRRPQPSRPAVTRFPVTPATLRVSLPVVTPRRFTPRINRPIVTPRRVMPGPDRPRVGPTRVLPGIMTPTVTRKPVTLAVYRPIVTPSRTVQNHTPSALSSTRPVTRTITPTTKPDLQPVLSNEEEEDDDDDSDEQPPAEKKPQVETKHSRLVKGSVPGDRYYPAPYPQYPPIAPARYPQSRWNRPVFRPPLSHPVPLPAPDSSSESREVLSGEVNPRAPVYYPNHHGASDSSDEEWYGPGIGANSDHGDDDSRESHEDDDSGYNYYHPPSRPWCPYVADIVIMMDGSDSLTKSNFNFGKRVMDQIIARLYLSQTDGFVVGAMFFSDSIQEVRLRPFKDNVYLRALVMNAYQEMGGTGTDYVLYNMRRLFFAEGRYGVPKIGVLMTDGRARNPATSIEQARMAKSEGIHLITVAVGVVTNPSELRAIASSPRSVVLNPTTNAILRLIQGYSSARCSGPVPIPPTYPPFPPIKPGLPVTLPPPIIPGRPSIYPPQITFPPPRPYPSGTPYPPPTQSPRPPFIGTPYPPTAFPTIRPPIIPQPPTRPPPPRRGPCDDCKFLNGIGYNPHESVCSYYYQCYNNNGILVPYQRACAFGLFWDQVDLTCKPPAAVDCASDPCKRSRSAYGAPGNCRAYWQCRWGRTISAQCCSYSHRFVSRQGCVYDTSCTVPCPPYQPIRPEVCNKKPYPMDDTQYYEDIGGGRTILRRCALGSAFVPEPACRCDRRTDVIVRPWECKADLYMPFDTDLEDKSGQRLDAFVDKVSVDRSPNNGAIGGGAAMFNGTGRILIWKYANDDLGSKFVIRLRYKALPALNMSRNEGIITNSDCQEQCSVAISYQRLGNTTTAKLRTSNTGVVRSLLTHNQGWNTVEYKYDGVRLSFDINGNRQSMAAIGNIAKVPAALQIGTGCMGYDPFIGLIDELYVYKCIP